MQNRASLLASLNSFNQILPSKDVDKKRAFYLSRQANPVLFELLQTEQNFNDDLIAMIKVLPPLYANLLYAIEMNNDLCLEESCKTLVLQLKNYIDDLKVLSSASEELCSSINDLLCNQMILATTPTEENKLSVQEEVAKLKEEYVQYFSALRVCVAFHEEHKAVVQALNKHLQKYNYNFPQIDIPQEMIKPVQRGPRHKLLWETFLKSEFAKKHQLEQPVQDMISVLKQLNHKSNNSVDMEVKQKKIAAESLEVGKLITDKKKLKSFIGNVQQETARLCASGELNLINNFSFQLNQAINKYGGKPESLMIVILKIVKTSFRLNAAWLKNEVERNEIEDHATQLILNSYIQLITMSPEVWLLVNTLASLNDSLKKNGELQTKCSNLQKLATYCTSAIEFTNHHVNILEKKLTQSENTVPPKPNSLGRSNSLKNKLKNHRPELNKLRLQFLKSFSHGQIEEFAKKQNKETTGRRTQSI